MFTALTSPYCQHVSSKLLRLALLIYAFMAITTLHHAHSLLLSLPLENAFVALILLLGGLLFFNSDEKKQKSYLTIFLATLPLIMTPLLSSLANADSLTIFYDAEYRTLLKMLLVAPFLVFVMDEKNQAQSMAQLIVIFFTILGGYFLFRYLYLQEIRVFDARPLLKIRHGDPNFLASFFVMVTPLAIYLSALHFQLKQKKQFVLFSFCSLFLVACVFLTQSRMAILALLISLGFLAFLNRKRIPRKLILAMGLVLGGIFVFNQSSLDRFQNITDKSNVDRISTYKNGLLVFFDAPFFGAGMHQAQKFYFDHTGYPDFQSLESSLDIHNSFLKSLADLGVVGLISYTLLFLIPLKELLSSPFGGVHSFFISSFLGLILCLMAIGATYKDLIFFFMLFLTFLSSALRTRES